MSNIKSEIGIVLVIAVTAIVFTALVASSVSSVQGADGNTSSSANNTSASPSGSSTIMLPVPQVQLQTVLDLRSDIRNNGISLQHNIDV